MSDFYMSLVIFLCYTIITCQSLPYALFLHIAILVYFWIIVIAEQNIISLNKCLVSIQIHSPIAYL